MWSEYWPDTSKQVARTVGNAASARKAYYKSKSSNLRYLMNKRYAWMNHFIKPGDKVLELGCGIGISKDFIRKDAKLTLTDIEPHPWVDRVVDALKTGYADKSFDVIICSNMIHHVAYPLQFFQETSRILKPGGRLVIQEPNCSFATKVIFRLLHHEGWSFKRDPFSLTKPSNDPKEPWSGNNAIPNLLFDNPVFVKKVPTFTFVYKKYTEFFLFPLSGGVVAKVRTVNLPRFALRIIDGVDEVLVTLLPSVFALSRRVVLERNSMPYSRIKKRK